MLWNHNTIIITISKLNKGEVCSKETIDLIAVSPLPNLRL